VIRKNQAKMLRNAGAGPGEIIQITFGYHFMPAGLGLHMGAEEIECTIIPAGTGESRMQIDFMKKLGTTIYAGTPSFLANLAKQAEAMNINPKKALKLKVGLCGAEPLPPSLRKQLQDNFGMELYDVYGVAELGLISRECERHNGMHINLVFRTS